MQVYADYNATTPLCDDVVNYLAQSKDFLGNMQSGHFYGQKVHQLYDEAIDSILDILNATDFELLSCSSATEANNWFFYSVLDQVTDCPRVITSTIEHACVLEPLKHYSELGKIDLQLCPVDKFGFLNMDIFKSLLNDSTKLVSICFASNELGTIQPLKDVCALAKSVGAITHSDIVQAVGKLPVNLNDMLLDAASVSSHKCYAPTGFGGLMVRDSNLIKPFLLGGSQQMKLRAGTVNVLGAILFLKGLKYCYKNMDKHVDVASWVKYFRDCSSIYTVISAPDQENVLWNTVNLVVNGKIAHDVMMKLDMHHIAVSTGSACSTGAVDVSTAISALERPDVTNGSVRISFGYPTTVNDLDFIVSKFIDVFN